MSSFFLFKDGKTEERITNCVDALYNYVEAQKTKQEDDNVLWTDERDINLLIEPKINRLFKGQTFNSIRIPLIHSFRGESSDNDICIITRTADVERWKEVLLSEHKVNGVTKIMGLTELVNDYKTHESRLRLSQLFDLFIIHPSIIYKIDSDLIRCLRNDNKSCALLPFAYNLLHLGPAHNPLKYSQKADGIEAEKQQQFETYAGKLAQMVARYRDSTFYMNYILKQKFVKIGDTGMEKEELKENLVNVLKYALPILPNGGVHNVLRLSLHLNHTTVQLPFYANLKAMSDRFSVVHPKQVQQIVAKSENVLERKQKEAKFKKAMRKNCPKKVKNALIHAMPMKNLKKLSAAKKIKQCMPEK